ncbi:hypothetical protein N2152v2_010252 [Parachlorella kessleri]
MGSRLIPLRSLLQQSSLALTRAVAVTSFRELPTAAVPALGESITDGTISTLLKQPGDSVAEDEPILQIETDKVVVDVRAPNAGVLEHYLVKENDTVVVGQPIATIGSGEGASAAPQPAAQEAASAPAEPTPEGAPPAPEQPQPPRKQQQQPAPSFASSAAAAAGDADHAKRKPLIRFPPRRTETGEVISSMPADKAKAYVEAATKKAQEAARPRPMIAPMFAKSGPPPPRAPRQLVRPPPILKTKMSDREMEAIMLGGAEP